MVFYYQNLGVGKGKIKLSAAIISGVFLSLLSIKVDLANNPAQACDPTIAALVMVIGMLDGDFTATEDKTI